MASYFSTGSTVLFFIIFHILLKGLDGREISRVIDGFNSTSTGDIEFPPPKLSSERLREIRMYDRMKCFPKLLCTLTKSDAFTKLGAVDLNDLADGYLRLLVIFPGGPPSDLITTGDDYMVNFKHDIETSNDDEFPMSHNDDGESDNDDDSDVPRKRDENESEELLLTDPLLHEKEKLEMKKLMDELIQEEKADASKRPSSWRETAMSLPLQIPFKLGTTLLTHVVMPYLAGDRKKRDLDKVTTLADNQDPIVKAMKLWNKLKSAKQCNNVYPTCPFESWEVVSMIKLIKDSAKQSITSS